MVASGHDARPTIEGLKVLFLGFSPLMDSFAPMGPCLPSNK